MTKRSKKRGINTIIEIIALILGLIAFLIGWMGYGGYLFGIPAIVIGFIFYRKYKGIISLLSIIFGCIGLAETIAVMHIFLPSLQYAFNETISELSKEKEITSLPYIIQLSEGKKLQISSIEIKKVNYVTENISYFTQNFKVYSPREGFTFYIVRYTLKNIGGEKINIFDLPTLAKLITTNNSYNPLYFFEMTTERGWQSFETNELRYADNICESHLRELYPNEEITNCIFFEVRENEKPEKLKFQIFLTIYYYKIE